MGTLTINTDKKELVNAAKRNWALNPQTQDYIKELEECQGKIFKETMNMSLSSPPDKDAILRNMIQAKTIQNTIDKISKVIITP